MISRPCSCQSQSRKKTHLPAKASLGEIPHDLVLTSSCRATGSKRVRIVPSHLEALQRRNKSTENTPNHCCRVLKSVRMNKSSEFTCFVRASAFCNLGSDRDTHIAFKSKFSSNANSNTCKASRISRRRHPKIPLTAHEGL
jgi:hypothetical protein